MDINSFISEKLAAGETPDSIAAQFTDALNSATTKDKEAQDIVDSINAYIKKHYPKLADTTYTVTGFLSTLDALNDIVDSFANIKKSPKKKNDSLDEAFKVFDKFFKTYDI